MMPEAVAVVLARVLGEIADMSEADRAKVLSRASEVVRLADDVDWLATAVVTSCPPPGPFKLVDRDGDEWTRADPDVDKWSCHQAQHARDFDGASSTFGPMTLG